MTDYKETALSKRKHADFMLKVADRLIALVFAGTLGISAMQWLHSGKPVGTEFGTYLVLLAVGSVIAIYLMTSALKRYASLESGNDLVPQASSRTITGCSTSAPVALSIEHGNTRITVHIQESVEGERA